MLTVKTLKTMHPTLDSKHRPKRFSHRSQQDEPDTRQVNYDDMFTALVPQSGGRKRVSKNRHTLPPPSLPGKDYVEQLLYYSRTKPLPPLPEDGRPLKILKSREREHPETSSWSGALRRWKRQFGGQDDSSRCSTPEDAKRQSSIDTLTSDSSNFSTAGVHSGRNHRFKSGALMPWSTSSRNAANRQSLMYGDLAEFPSTKSKSLMPARTHSARDDDSARRKVDRKRPSEEAQGRAGSRMAEKREVRFEGTNWTNEVSREDWEHLWRQYQHLSKLLQDALIQRTSELT